MKSSANSYSGNHSKQTSAVNPQWHGQEPNSYSRVKKLSTSTNGRHQQQQSAGQPTINFYGMPSQDKKVGGVSSQSNNLKPNIGLTPPRSARRTSQQAQHQQTASLKPSTVQRSKGNSKPVPASTSQQFYYHNEKDKNEAPQATKLQVKIGNNTRKTNYNQQVSASGGKQSQVQKTKSKMLSVSPVGNSGLVQPLISGKNVLSGHHFGLTPHGQSPMANGCLSSSNVTPQHGFKRDISKQTLQSDILLATESSIQHNGHRDNIKLFSFKPGGIKQQHTPNMVIQNLKIKKQSPPPPMSNQHQAFQMTPISQVNLKKQRPESKSKSSLQQTAQPKQPQPVSTQITQCSPCTSNERSDEPHFYHGDNPNLIVQPTPQSVNQASNSSHSNLQGANKVGVRRSGSNLAIGLNQNAQSKQGLVCLMQSGGASARIKQMPNSSSQTSADFMYKQNQQQHSNRQQQIRHSVALTPSEQIVQVKRRGNSEKHTTVVTPTDSCLLDQRVHQQPPLLMSKGATKQENKHSRRSSSNKQKQSTNGSIAQTPQQQTNKNSHRGSSQPLPHHQQPPIFAAAVQASLNKVNKDQADPKEQIVQHIKKFIKAKGQSQAPKAKEADNSDEIIKNLRDFLTYLEGKGIINQQKLQNKQEMKNLLKDIMKLDLTKFSRPRGNSNSPSNGSSNKQNLKAQNPKQRKVHPSPNPPEVRTVPTQSSVGASSQQMPLYGYQQQQYPTPQANSRALSKDSQLKQQMQQQHGLALNGSSSRKLSPDQQPSSTTSAATILQQQQQPVTQQQFASRWFQAAAQPPAGGFHLANKSNLDKEGPKKKHTSVEPSPRPETSKRHSGSTGNLKVAEHQVQKNNFTKNQDNLFTLPPQQQMNGPSPNAESRQYDHGKPQNASNIYQVDKSKVNIGTPVHQEQPQVPTIQLMINTSGQSGGNGQQIGINVNNYCITTPQQQNLDNNYNSDKNKQAYKAHYTSKPESPISQNEPSVNLRSNSSKRANSLKSEPNMGSQQPQTSSNKQNSALDNSIASAINNFSNQQMAREQLQSHGRSSSATTTGTGATGKATKPEKVILNDSVTSERERLIRYIKQYVKKHNQIPHTTLDFYKFVKLLGKGAFGKITLGVHKLTGKYVAIKSIDKANIKDEYSRRKVFQEVYILKKIRHSCVIRLLEVFESEKHFLMVMEYEGGGDLLQYVKKRKRLNEQSAKAIFKQILYALGHCHCRSVLHRDIKLDNVLMDGDGGVKLCDFGVSRLVKKGQVIHEQCGTPAYLAPEIIIDKGYQGFFADIWSLGVLLYAMVQGTVPFKASNIADLHKIILKGEFEFPVDTVSEEVKDLIQRMLVLKPESRISMPQMLNHPWVRDVEKGFGDLDAEEEEDDEHDLRVGTTFFRQEVLNGLIPGGAHSGANENGNINFVNVENLYYRGGKHMPGQPSRVEDKVSYSDYCALTEDFMTYRIDEEAMAIVTGYGYPRSLVIESINRGDVNHATAAYYLLVYQTDS